MSGTSLDGIDAALVTTDGVAVQSTGVSLTVACDAGLRGRLREILGSRDRNERIDSIERELILAQSAAAQLVGGLKKVMVKRFLINDFQVISV
jgi:anhydro-N-acetylmuramic acid kinase